MHTWCKVKVKVMVIHKNRIFAPTMMHTWCKYGECSLNRSWVIVLTRWYDVEGQGHDLKDEGQGHDLKMKVKVTSTK